MSDRIIRFKTCPVCKQEFQCPKKIGLANWTKRICCSIKCKANGKKLLGENHPLWKGDNAGYSAIHKWIERQLGRPSYCEFNRSHISTKFEWANISGEYRRDITDFVRLCASCHRLYDRNWKNRQRNTLGRFL